MSDYNIEENENIKSYDEIADIIKQCNDNYTYDVIICSRNYIESIRKKRIRYFNYHNDSRYINITLSYP